MAQQRIVQDFYTDKSGNPAGGTTKSMGLSIVWHRGPIRTSEGEARETNGCLSTKVLAALINRLEYIQQTNERSEKTGILLTDLKQCFEQLLSE